MSRLRPAAPQPPRATLVFGPCAGLVCAVLLSAGCGPNRPESIAPAALSAEWFTDATERAALRFSHVAGARYSMPELMGSGIALLDYDADGLLDVYFVQNGGLGSGASNQLFRQEPDGSFRDVSQGSGADVVGPGMGAFAGDVNNDGLPDLLLTEYGAVRLLQNLGQGKFNEVTMEAGLDNPRWAVPGGFIDYDRDGWLDVAVGNYLDYDPTYRCTDHSGQEDFCSPSAFAPTISRIWRNVTREAGKAPRFEDVTELAGLAAVPGAALGLVCADFTGDGWPDLFFADDARPNRLFVNQQNGRFVDEAVARGLAYNAMGATAGNMGIAFGDIDNDGLGDLFVTHLAEEFHSLWKQGPAGFFLDRIATSGLQRQGWRGTGFGAVLADFDCDGSADIAFVNGLVRRDPVAVQTPLLAGTDRWWAPYAQRPQLFSNNGQFQDISASNPAFCAMAMAGRSLVVGDLDADGAPDLLAGCVAGPARFFRNIAPSRGHWLRLRLIEPRYGGRDAIGAEARVTAAGRSWHRTLQPATSYLASNDPTLHFGLGKAAVVDQIEVQWPDGYRELFPGGPVDRLLTLQSRTGLEAGRQARAGARAGTGTWGAWRGTGTSASVEEAGGAWGAAAGAGRGS